MNIGFVSAWFERGAAYVTRAYIDLLKDNNNIFVYARGGEHYGINDPKWDLPYVTWGYKLSGSDINYKHFKEWINKNAIDIIFFNEQQNMDIVVKIKREFLNIKLGSYIDYYKKDTVEEFILFDFLICNTKRHYSVFKNHPQCFYVPWGTNIDLFKPKVKNNEFTFFHSVGMSKRKGTDLLIKAFIQGELFNKSKLIIHSQIDIEKNFGYKVDYLNKFNIEVIKKTVSAPGLYNLGDIYVYPTTLDGLGLTLYEALACGLPVITTNCAPMNEVITDEVGYLVSVEEYCTRSDGYYWPLSYCSIDSLIKRMEYFIENSSKLKEYKYNARSKAVKYYNWNDRKEIINDIFKNTHQLTVSENLILKMGEKIKYQNKIANAKRILKYLIKMINKMK